MKVNFVYGQTGSGKTHRIREIILGHLKDKKKQNKIIVCALGNLRSAESTHFEIRKEVNKSFDKKRAAEIISQMNLYISGSKEPFMLDTYSRLKSVGKKFTFPRVIITTHAYLNTRGHSFVLYAFQVDLF